MVVEQLRIYLILSGLYVNSFPGIYSLIHLYSSRNTCILFSSSCSRQNREMPPPPATHTHIPFPMPFMHELPHSQQEVIHACQERWQTQTHNLNTDQLCTHNVDTHNMEAAKDWCLSVNYCFKIMVRSANRKIYLLKEWWRWLFPL